MLLATQSLDPLAMAQPTATGPPEYKTYAEYINDVNQQGIYNTLRDSILPDAENRFGRWFFTFFDLCTEGKVTQYCLQASNSPYKRPTDGKPQEIMNSLRESKDITSRIVIIYGQPKFGSGYPPTWAVNVLGLGANIEPSFFHRYYADKQPLPLNTRNKMKVNPIKIKERWAGASHHLPIGTDSVLILNQPPLPKTGEMTQIIRIITSR